MVLANKNENNLKLLSRSMTRIPLQNCLLPSLSHNSSSNLEDGGNKKKKSGVYGIWLFFCAIIQKNW